MTESSARCDVLPPSTVALYAAGGLIGAAAWSVETHAPGCPACRGILTTTAGADRLERNLAVVLVRTGLPRPGPLTRALRRCGIPEYVIVLLQATPSLRRSWVASVLAVLAIIVGSSQLAAALEARPGAGLSPGHLGWTVLVPFLVITPLLPLAAVAAAFSPVVDPAWRLTAAAPLSTFWLLCVRSTAVVAATLVPVALAALALPGPLWLAVALLLPTLTISVAAIALATVVRPDLAALIAGLAWVVLVIAVAVSVGSPVRLLGLPGQLVAAVVLGAGAALTALRRNTIDYGWMT